MKSYQEIIETQTAECISMPSRRWIASHSLPSLLWFVRLEAF
jgi:hypothetical protein